MPVLLQFDFPMNGPWGADMAEALRGLARDIATTLAVQTVLGSAQMLSETGEHPARLKDMVTSPGGTTIAGVHALEQAGLRAAFMDAIVAATNRSRELGS